MENLTVNPENYKILVVDDIATNILLLKAILGRAKYRIVTATGGREALEKVESESPDLILLDIMMPKLDGYEVCKKIREKKNTPIIMLTARAEELDKVLGLELGADDYVTKPFGVRELMARVKANLRKSVVREEAPEQAPAGKGNFGKLDINPDRYEVRKDGRIIDLTVREFELLKYLSAQKGQVFSRETLLEKVWGYEYFGDVRTVDVTIRRLREKIEDDPGKPVYILTKRGVGYYFDC